MVCRYQVKGINSNMKRIIAVQFTESEIKPNVPILPIFCPYGTYLLLTSFFYQYLVPIGTIDFRGSSRQGRNIGRDVILITGIRSRLRSQVTTAIGLNKIPERKIWRRPEKIGHHRRVAFIGIDELQLGILAFGGS
jgi:hypothetical protein